jgi:hypothetical protein
VLTTEPPTGTGAGTGSGSKLTVLNPMGYPPRVMPKQMAPRLDTLEGKRVFLVDCRFDDSAKLLEQIQAWFAERLPGVSTRMVQLGGLYSKDDPQLWARIKAEGQAAILGVGH